MNSWLILVWTKDLQLDADSMKADLFEVPFPYLSTTIETTPSAVKWQEQTSQNSTLENLKMFTSVASSSDWAQRHRKCSSTRRRFSLQDAPVRVRGMWRGNGNRAWLTTKKDYLIQRSFESPSNRFYLVNRQIKRKHKQLREFRIPTKPVFIW